MSDFKFTVSEADYRALMRSLEELADIKKKPIIRQAYKSGGQILISAGKASFLSRNKKKTGNLYNSFTSKMKKKNSGILIGFRRGKGLGNHAHLIDRGTVDRYTKKGYYRGRIDGTNAGKTGKTLFWTSVVESRGQEAMNRIVSAIYDAIDEIKSRN